MLVYLYTNMITKDAKNIIDHLENEVDWNRIFGASDCLYSDSGFVSNSDNFIRATSVEKAISKFSKLIRVDKDGYDFIFIDSKDTYKIELKMSKKLFQKRNPFKTKKFKVKSFLSEKKTIEDYKNKKIFDYMIILDLTAKRVILIEDECVRPLYETGADGAMIHLDIGNYYECNIGKVNTIHPKMKLSNLIDKAIEEFLNF